MQLKRMINSSSASKSHIGRLSASTYNNIKTLGKVKGSCIIPMAYISGNMRCSSMSLSLKFPDISITGFDFSQLGIPPFWSSDSLGNTLNFLIDSMINLMQV